MEEPVEEVVTRPRRRGEPRPEPEPQPEPAAEQEPAVAEVEAEAEAEQPEPQPTDEPEPEPQAPPAPLAAQVAQLVQAALPVAEITRQCSFCFAQMPLSQLDQVGPLMLQCKDASACAERAAASGMYPMDERLLEQDIASFENRSGALR